MSPNEDNAYDKTAGLAVRLEEINAIAQNGLIFTKDAFDVERYQRLQALTSEMLALISNLPTATVRDWLCLDRNYITPKADVRALVVRGDKILMVQERSDGLWTLPGGWCEINYSPRETVEKEVLEESGLDVRASRLLALFDKHKHDHPPQIPHAYKCFFLCEEVGGRLVNGTLETGKAEFFQLSRLPPLSLHRVTPKQLHTIFEIALDPGRACAFD
jgi:ADP-ribose pyrophosphatase YjhB (NUDIX family)